MAYDGPYLGDDEDREYEDAGEYEAEDEPEDRDLGDDMPEWWQDDMPDDWYDLMGFDYDAYEYEEFEIGIDYGETT